MEIKFRITIDDRIVNFFKVLFKKKNFRIGLVIFTVCTSLIVYAAITKPFTFSANTTISSDQVNQNFNVLYTESNAQDGRIRNLEGSTFYFPDGITNAISINTIGTGITTVTTGETWYITSVENMAAANNLLIDTSVSFNLPASPGGRKTFNPPLILKEGTQLTATLNTINATILKVNTGVTVINHDLSTGNDLTIPSGTTLFVLNTYNNGATVHTYEIDNKVLYYSESLELIPHAVPLIFPGGSILSTDSSNTFKIFGYYK